MSRWRVVTVAVLILGPFAVLAGVGWYYLWTLGWGLYSWFALLVAVTFGYLLAWYWQRKRLLLRPPPETTPSHWTERDQRAWQLVEARAKAVTDITAEQLGDVHFYVSLAQDMGRELAHFYHPKAEDPIGPLTIPEILAVIELAAHDMAELVDQNLPGGHLLTIHDWRRARQMADWYQRASNIYWLVAAVFAPWETGLRYAASRLGMGKSFELLQQNLLAWFYMHLVHRLGTYLIELNSGRLRVGATRYRELMRSLHAPATATEAPETPPDEKMAAAAQVTITVLGQVKVGKSSLINALLGEQKAITDVLPATATITRYELKQAGLATQLHILDTVGYAHAGPKADQVHATRQAAKDSELLLLVLHACNPARQADLDMLRQLRDWFASQPQYRLPPVLAVMTHIDLLSPALEWEPPYNWQQPRRPKEQHIQQALAAVRQQLGDYLVGVIPVCAAEGKVYGVQEWLLPALVKLLDDAHAVSLLRCLHAEANRDKIRKIFTQLRNAGAEALKALWASAK
ncbi:MAG: GTPase family protein [Gemmataceae bacterium]